MIAYARHVFRGAQAVKGAAELGAVSDHIASIERQTGRKVVVDGEVMEAPDAPEVLWYLWEWYGELGTRRQSHGMGVNPISFAEIGHWARLTDRDPTPWEVSVLLRLDNAQLATLREAK